MRVAFKEGQFVHRGDLLAEIDPRPFQVQLDQAEGQLAKDQAQLVKREGPSSPAIQLLLSAGFDCAIQRGRTSLDRRPAGRRTEDGSGRHQQRQAQPDLYARDITDQPGRSACASSTWATSSAPPARRGSSSSPGPTDCRRVHATGRRAAVGAAAPEGQRCFLSTSDRSGATHLAAERVETADDQIDQTTGTVRVKALFENHGLRPVSRAVRERGLVADMRRDQVVVPAVAVQHGPQGAFVYVVADGKAVDRR